MKETDSVILVIGGTGRCGSALTRKLLRQGVPVRVLTRCSRSSEAKRLVDEGAEIVEGNLDDLSLIERQLFRDVEQACLITSPVEGFEAEVRQGGNFIRAAARAGIKHLIFQSVLFADTLIPHCRTKGNIEALLKLSDLPFTIVRPGIFLEVIDDYLNTWIQAGKPPAYFDFAVNPEAATSWLSIDDLSRALAAIAMAFAPEGSTYDLAAPEGARLNHALREVTDVQTGLELRFSPISLERLVRIKLDSEEANRFALNNAQRLDCDYYQEINSGEHLADIGPISRDFGIVPMSVKEYLTRRLQSLSGD